MEFVGVKRGRSRKKTRNLKKQRSQQIKFEVKFSKRRGLISDRNNIFVAKEKVIVNTMQANSFWENYTAAQEWQKRLVDQFILTIQVYKVHQNFIEFIQE